ncbi:MAG TPA: RHS repeat domain-containing protein [Armatimonadota bacterium]|nr:RHS repeat domain-containing protein [Armatimonadota bacterium]
MRRCIAIVGILCLAIALQAETPNAPGADGKGPPAPAPNGIASSIAPPWAEDSVRKDSCPTGPNGPSAASFVVLGTGAYENEPEADLWVKNPTGPTVGFFRVYRTALAVQGRGSPGFSTGWAHGFDTVAVGPSEPTWGKITIFHYNGAKEELTPELKDGVPTGSLKAAPGTPSVIKGQPGKIPGRWDWIGITVSDGITWVLCPTQSNPNIYRYMQVKGNVGGPVRIYYDVANRLDRIVSDRDLLLLKLTYDSVGYLSTATSYDAKGAPSGQIKYAFGPAAGATCLLGVSLINQPTSAACMYGYTAVNGRPFLSSVSVPNPSGKGGASTHRINYDTLGRVSSMVDANGNQRTYTYQNGQSKPNSPPPQ